MPRRSGAVLVSAYFSDELRYTENVQLTPKPTMPRRTLRKAVTSHQRASNTSSLLARRRRKSSNWGAMPKLKSLEVYKADDALTTSSMNANYLLYLSQRPEDTEIQGVKKVIQAFSTCLFRLFVQATIRQYL